jgi:hypothetical protein
LIKDEVRSGGSKRSLESAYSQEEGQEAGMEKSSSSSPQKSPRDMQSNGSVHSGRALSFDSQDSVEENENSDPQNVIEAEEIPSVELVKGATAVATTTSMLPKLTRSRSKLNKSQPIR